MSLIDLSQPLASGIPVYPGDPEVRIEPHADFDSDGYRVRSVHLGTHSGTHIDAPSHTEEDGADLDSFDLDRFRFEARLVDVRNVDARSPIPPSVLPEPPAGGSSPDLYVFRTEWSVHWGTDRYYEHPYLAPDTARKCARRDAAVGIDALSPDPTHILRQSEKPGGGKGPELDEDYGVPAHHILLGKKLPILENLRNLDSVPNRFRLHAYPLRLSADASPVRAVAEPLPERQ